MRGLSASRRGNHIEQLTLERLSEARDQLDAMIDARQQPQVPAPVTVRDATGSTGARESDGNID